MFQVTGAWRYETIHVGEIAFELQERLMGFLISYVFFMEVKFTVLTI